VDILPAVLGVAFAAFFICLAVRIINRRELWAIRVAVAVPTCLFLIGVWLFLTPGIHGSGHAVAQRRSQCKNNLKQIGLALFNYHERYGSFPPAYVADARGKPMHSWRVLLLPFLDQQPLYDKYRFDEPWDGPNNRKLAASIVSVYTCPEDDLHRYKNHKRGLNFTSYVTVVGDETAWPSGSTTSWQSIADGPSNTLLIVDVADSGIHWMEPRDLHIVQMAPTINSSSGQGISSPHTGGAFVLLGDGSAKFVPESLTPEDLRAWLTPNGGDLSQGARRLALEIWSGNSTSGNSQFQHGGANIDLQRGGMPVSKNANTRAGREPERVEAEACRELPQGASLRISFSPS